MEEIWKSMYKAETLYSISNLGRVKALEKTVHRSGPKARGKTQRRKEKLLSPSVKGGYLWLGLYWTVDGVPIRKFISVHRLVFESHVRPLELGEEIDHMDGNKYNNRVDNLQALTRLEHAPLRYQRAAEMNYQRGFQDGYKKALEEANYV